jgi:DNA-binding NarL/FixJ family response regulator
MAIVELDSETDLQIIKELYQLLDIPKILVVGNSNHELILAAIAGGANGFWHTSSTPSQLRAALESVSIGAAWLDPMVAPAVLQTRTQAFRPPTQSPLRVPLSPREREVLRLIGNGKTNKEIAATLGLSDETVKCYVRSVFYKLDVEDRTQAAVRAFSCGLAG